MRDNICTEYDKEVDYEYFKLECRLSRCKNEDEVTLQYGLHLARLFSIQNKFAKHEKAIERNGIDLGR